MTARPARAEQLAVAALGLSIGLLALNDHVLKGHPAFPGWLTGKLSDFAGLIAAPLTLIALLGAKARSARLLCLVAPALFLTLINLSVECSRAVVGALAMIGLSWKLWPDPTDLWSLSVLPLAWLFGSWLRRSSGASRARQGPSLRVKALGLIGAVACLATSAGAPMHSARAYVVNATGRPLLVEVAELVGPVDCSGPPIESDLLRHDDFAPGTRYLLEAKGVLPLPGPESAGSCGPVRVVVPGLTMGVDWDRRAEPRELPNSIDFENLEDTRQLVIIPTDDSNRPPTFGSGTRRLGIASDTDPVVVSDCPQAALPRLDFSGENGLISGLTLIERQALTAECFRVSLAKTLDGPPERTLYLCIPEVEFPFVVGDVLDGHVADDDLKLSRRPEATPSLELFRGYWDGTRGELRVEAASCSQMRDGCGAVWQPLDVSISSGDRASIPLLAGERVVVPDGAPSTYYLIRALRPLVVRPECDPASGRTGTWIEFVKRTD